MRRSWMIVTLFNFLVAAVMGLLLRAMFLWEIPWVDYRNWLHGHSHVAMLGWAYLLFYALLVDRLLPVKKQNSPFYQWLFYLTQFSVLGMMVSFPIQGYGAVSIGFSTLHIGCSYLFVYRIWKDMRGRDSSLGHWFRLGLGWMVISTFGVWALGPIMIFLDKSAMLYQSAIQFYLHFQFNGWFLPVSLGLLMLLLDSVKSIEKGSRFWFFVGFYTAGIILTYFHVLHWAFGNSVFYLLNSMGVVFQGIAFMILARMYWDPIKYVVDRLAKIAKILFYFGLFSFTSKVLLQVALVVPFVAEMSTIIRPLMVGYIHLCMIGTVSAWGVLSLYHWAGIDYPVWALRSWLLGFSGTEVLLFVQGGMYAFRLGAFPAYHECLWAMSCLLALGIAMQLVYLLIVKQPLINKRMMASA